MEQEHGTEKEKEQEESEGQEAAFISGNFGDVQIDILGLGALGIGQVSACLTARRRETQN